MIQSLLNLPANATLDEMRARLGEVLGLEGPAPLEAVLRAVDDPDYASSLLACRNAPAFLEALFEDERTRVYAARLPQNEHSNLALAGKVMTAMVRWGRAGFSTVDEETLARREAACLICPNLTQPKGLQQIVPTGEVADRLGNRLGGRVCALCGCVTSKKIRLPTEFCPDRHPGDGSLTRWGEPRPVAAPAQGAV